MTLVATSAMTAAAEPGDVGGVRRSASRGLVERVLVVRVLRSPIGEMVAAADDEGLWLLEFCGDEQHDNSPDPTDSGSVINDCGARGVRSAARLRDAARRERGLAIGFASGSHRYLDQAELELNEYGDGGRRAFDVPTVLVGSAFQVRVWRALLTIPFGRTLTYAGLASAVGYDEARHAARAVGQANGSNRIAVVVPCHRVIAAEGGVGGYAGGLARKRRLLWIEGVQLRDTERSLFEVGEELGGVLVDTVQITNK